MEKEFVSGATKNNWKRLGVNPDETLQRLNKRANKRFSKKQIIPVEYFSNKDNIDILKEILIYIAEKNIDITTAIYNLALNYLSINNIISMENNKVKTNKQYLPEILNEFSISNNITADEYLTTLEYPVSEIDFLGIVYQSLLNEGSKNRKGSYYTPEKIIKSIIPYIKNTDLFLDPCCGTGSFLLRAAQIIQTPENIYGCDLDEIACFISRINLIVKFKNKDFRPNIFNTDFLLDKKFLNNIKIDVIATNPPWGALTREEYNKLYPEINSGESFSYFIVKAFQLLADCGHCHFVLPESILNVAVHKDIRKFILDNLKIEEIKMYKKAFSGVLTDVTLLRLTKIKSGKTQISTENTRFSIEQEIYYNNKNYNFTLLNSKDLTILNKIYSVEFKTLDNSKWALGIVTGDNKKHITSIKKSGSEKIYSGKNIHKYILKDSDKFIVFTPEKFQQTANVDIYRAPEKLIYKFISKKLVFAYDTTKALVLNSANIIIPEVKTHSIKTILAFLNSELFQYIYKKKFNELKILKGNLLQLPLPLISKSQKSTLETLVNEYLNYQDPAILESIDKIVYKCFNLSAAELKYIKQEVN